MGDFSQSETLDADAGRRVVTIPAKDWKKFIAWANRPAAEIQQLKDLARTMPTWQR